MGHGNGVTPGGGGGGGGGSHLSAYMDGGGHGGGGVDTRSLASFTDDFLPLPALPPPNGHGQHHQHLQQQVQQRSDLLLYLINWSISH